MRRLNFIMKLAAAFALLLYMGPLPNAAAEGTPHQTTVLFTHDLHSHFLPQETEHGGESGGYARLMTALKQERAVHPEALTVDAGDFSIGSLIQTLYSSKAPELRTMGAMGFDATTAGNHEFDHTGDGFVEMLTAARKSGDPTPTLLMSNYRPSPERPDQLDVQRAVSAYGVRETLIIERGGVSYGLFGLMGEDAHACAPTSGFVRGDPVDAAKRCVDSLRERGADFIICLSHSGTNEKASKSEDEQLAKQVEGIDLIVSGHTHTTLDAPVVVGNTYIVSAGPYCSNLGSITLEWTEDGQKTLRDYRLIPIDETLEEDSAIQSRVESWKEQVNKGYLSSYHMTYDQKLTQNPWNLMPPEGDVQAGNALGELVADSYRWAVQQAEGEESEPVAVAVTAAGVLRAPILSGAVTTSEAFDVLSMGVGKDGSSGFPLVSCYLTGKEIRAMLEIDASITPIMPEVQLYVSGVQYKFNPHRMFFNRVMRCQLQGEDGSLSELEEDRLYRVVSGLYSAQMLSTVKEKSFGLLSLVPKDREGVPIEDFTDHIVYQSNGSELKEWYALASYLQSFGGEGIPARYAQSDGRKEVSTSWNPIELVYAPNWITLVTCLAVVLVIALVVMLIRRSTRGGWRKGGGYRRRRLF